MCLLPIGARKRRLSRVVSAPQVTLLLNAAKATESWHYEELVNYCLTNKLEMHRSIAYLLTGLYSEYFLRPPCRRYSRCRDW
jgi:hypothetical protein